MLAVADGALAHYGSGEIAEGVILMWANERLLNRESGRGRNLTIHYLDDDGAVLDERPVLLSDMLMPGTLLPPRWIDMAGQTSPPKIKQIILFYFIL